MTELSNQYLLFEVDEEYALPLEHVLEIIESADLTRVPETPDYVAGILNLRGHVIPVIDVRRRFKKPPKEVKRRCIIITDIEESRLGLLVDHVIDLTEIAPNQLSEVPQVGSNYIHVFIKHIGIQDGKMHLIVDPERIINYDDIRAMSGGRVEKTEADRTEE